MTAPPAKRRRQLVAKMTQRFELLEKAMQRTLKASQRAEPRQVSESRPAQANPVRL
jgi:hypothetical protein